MEAFVDFYSTNEWGRIWPELALALAAITLLGIDLFGKEKSSGKTGLLAIGFQAALLVFHLLDYLFWHHTQSLNFFSDMLSQGLQSDVMRSFFLLSSLLVSILAHHYLRQKRLGSGEFHHLTMLATAGLMLLCQSNHFLMLFVALETVAICFYTLVAYNRHSSKSLEAGIKYLVFGALSSSLLLLGIVLLYGVGANPEAWGGKLSRLLEHGSFVLHLSWQFDGGKSGQSLAKSGSRSDYRGHCVQGRGSPFSNLGS